MATDAQNPDAFPPSSPADRQPAGPPDSPHQLQVQRLILESAKDYTIFTMDFQRRITSWNPGAQTMFGYCQKEILGQLGDILFTPQDQAAGAPQWEAQTALREEQANNALAIQGRPVHPNPREDPPPPSRKPGAAAGVSPRARTIPGNT